MARPPMFEDLVLALMNETLDLQEFPLKKIIRDLDELISHNPSCVRVTGQGGLTLAHAVAKDKALIGVTRLLIKRKVPFHPDEYGAQPWHTAASYRNVAAIAAYYDAWYDITEPFGPINWNILHVAALFNDAEALEWMLSRGVEVDPLDKFDRTPLFVAVQYQREEAATLLCSYFADETKRTNFEVSVTGAACYFMPDLAQHFMDEIIEDVRGDVRDISFYLEKFGKEDLTLMVNSQRSTDILNHKIPKFFVNAIMRSVKRYELTYFVLLILELISVSFICITKFNNFWYMSEMKNVEEFLSERITLVISLAILVITSFLRNASVVHLIFAKKECASIMSANLTGCTKTAARFSIDYSAVAELEARIMSGKKRHIMNETIWTLIITPAKACIVILCLMELDPGDWKEYMVFVCTIIIYFDVIFNGLTDIHYIPNFVMTIVLSTYRCIGRFIRMLMAIILLVIPYFFILIKFTYYDNQYFTNYNVTTTGNVTAFRATSWGLSFFFKAMLADDYRVTYFSDKYPYFFMIYNVVVLFFMSLVMLNLIIAETSALYESMVDNSKAEILSQHINNIVIYNFLYKKKFERRNLASNAEVKEDANI